MTEALTMSFERIRLAIASLERPAGEFDRATFWILDRLVGVARTSADRIEIFLVGTLKASLPLVKRHLEVGAWQGKDGATAFSASRIVLPEGAHFEPIAAVIAVELLSQGNLDVAGGLQTAFNSVEPIVDMALRNLALSEDSIIGLLGEMLTLEQLLLSASHGKLPSASVVGSWRGYERSSRDFVFGDVAIEVKATRAQVSRHRVSSLGQVEARQLPTGKLERLWLLSIGLVKIERGGQSISLVASRLLNLLSDDGSTALQDILLQNLARYGGGLETGYDHTSMSSWPVFNQEYEVSFTPRLYDLADSEVKLLRSEDLHGTHVEAAEVEYTFTLPERVNDRNPERAWQRMLITILRALPT